MSMSYRRKLGFNFDRPGNAACVAARAASACTVKAPLI
jgi:hypothetical protein